MTRSKHVAVLRTDPRYLRHPLDLAFVDGEVDQPGDDPERDGQVPDEIVAAGRVVQLSAQPRAEKAADLMRKESKPGQHRHVTHAEDLRDDPVGGWHRR